MNEALVVSLTCTFLTAVDSQRSTENSSVQVCDATGDHQSTNAGYKKLHFQNTNGIFLNRAFLILQIHEFSHHSRYRSFSTFKR